MMVIAEVSEVAAIAISVAAVATVVLLGVVMSTGSIRSIAAKLHECVCVCDCSRNSVLFR